MGADSRVGGGKRRYFNYTASRTISNAISEAIKVVLRKAPASTQALSKHDSTQKRLANKEARPENGRVEKQVGDQEKIGQSKASLPSPIRVKAVVSRQKPEPLLSAAASVPSNQESADQPMLRNCFYRKRSMYSERYVQSHRKDWLGPTRESNWVIPGKLLVGAYPFTWTMKKQKFVINKRDLLSLIDAGITTFVCLQDEATWTTYEEYLSSQIVLQSKRNHKVVKIVDTKQKKKRQGRFIYPYIYDAADLLTEKYGTDSMLQYYHLPIVDLHCTDDDHVFDLAYHIAKQLACQQQERFFRKGNQKHQAKIYIHCWGGHGRTGTLVAVILGLLYDISSAEALAWTQAFHDIRKCKLKVNSPQTKDQCDQVCRVLASQRAHDAKLEFGQRSLQAPPRSVYEKHMISDCSAVRKPDVCVPSVPPERQQEEEEEEEEEEEKQEEKQAENLKQLSESAKLFPQHIEIALVENQETKTGESSHLPSPGMAKKNETKAERQGQGEEKIQEEDEEKQEEHEKDDETDPIQEEKEPDEPPSTIKSSTFDAESKQNQDELEEKEQDQAISQLVKCLVKTEILDLSLQFGKMREEDEPLNNRMAKVEKLPRQVPAHLVTPNEKDLSPSDPVVTASEKVTLLRYPQRPAGKPTRNLTERSPRQRVVALRQSLLV